MDFLTTMAAGVETIQGRGGLSMAMTAGKQYGRQLAEDCGATDDLLRAIDTVRSVISGGDHFLQFEPYKPKKQSVLIATSDPAYWRMYLVFRNCSIRDSLMHHSQPLESSMCTMVNGLFIGALETVLGKKVSLETKQSGEKGCLKLLTVHL